MSVIFNSGTEAALRTTNVVAGSSDYSCFFYLKMSAAGAGYRTAFITTDSIATPTAFIAFFTDTASLDLKLHGDNGSGGTFTSTGFTLTAGQWVRVAYVRVGLSNRFYVNGTLIDSDTLDMSGATLAEEQIGNDGASDSNLEIAYFREWDTALNVTEVIAEGYSQTAVLTSNLITDTPLVSDLADDSGNSNDWSAVGSLTFDATKPAFPANATRATATAIASLPHSGTQDVWSEGLAYEVWYSYTAAPGDEVLGFWAYGDGLTPYGVNPFVYIDAGTTNIITTSSTTNKPLRFSITSGTEYIFRLVPSTQAPASADLIIEAELFSQGTAPVGSIVVNDDAEADYYPLGIFSSTDGDDYNVLTYVKDIVVGEAGDVLDDGKFLLSDADGTTLSLYNGDMSLITTVAINLGTRRSIRCCRGTQTFFVGSAGNPVIVDEVDDTGAILDTWTLTGISTIAAIAASNDKTVLYFSGTSNQPIRRWDLVNDVALSNFLAATVQATDILVLDDDTILIGFQALTGSSANFTVKHYDSSATLLDTYDFGTNLTPGSLVRAPCRMAYAIDDPNSFWVYLHPVAPDNGISVFRNVKVSDGSTLAEVEQAEFNLGVYSADASLTPAARFGNSLSCPFFISRVEVGPPSSDGTIVVEKVTVPSSDATAFDFTAGGGLSPAEFSLSHGESQIYNSVTPGSGYSVEETANILYQTTVEVSNGSPIDNITVAEGETVTVTFTNSASYAPGFNTRAVKRRWLRRSPIYSKENGRVRYKLFQLDCEIGTGNSAAPGDDPQVYLRYSDDWGQTWSFIMPMSMGQRGQYGTQLQWWRLGVGRNRVFEVYGSDPVKVALIDGFAKVDPGTDGD